MRILGVSVSWSLSNFLEVDYFYFWSLAWKVHGFISRNIRFLLILELERSISWNIKNFFGVVFFYFLAGLRFWKCKKRFLLRKYKKSFSLRKYNFFNIRARKFHFPKYKEFFCLDFFVFLVLGFECAPSGS